MCRYKQYYYFQISLEAVFIKMLGANDEMFFPSTLTSSLYIGQSLFPDTRVFVFARQFMEKKYHWKY